MTQPSETPPTESWGFTRVQRVALGILVALLLGCLTVQYVRRPATLGSEGVQREVAASLPRRMDPNTASVAELTRIPNLAEAVAKKIVEYREERKSASADHIVFRQPEDLTRVPGIKQKSLSQFLPYLEFPPEPEVVSAATEP